MIKRIIIEGADQQGKSTLAKMLSEKLGWDVVHYGKPSVDFNFYKDYLFPENTISDRNFLSEVVYSQINERDSRVFAIGTLQQVLKAGETILILMDRGAEFKFDKGREEEYKKNQIEKAIKIYREEFKNVALPKFIINPNCLCYESNIDMLIELMK